MTELTPPDDCNDMATLRQQIDRLDRVFVELLAQRAAYIDRASELKTRIDWPARIPERVEQVIQNARRTAIETGADPELVEQLWRQLVEWSIAREARVIREE